MARCGDFENLVNDLVIEMPISAGATRVHGITDADVAGEPTLRQYAKDLQRFPNQPSNARWFPFAILT